MKSLIVDDGSTISQNVRNSELGAGASETVAEGVVGGTRGVMDVSPSGCKEGEGSRVVEPAITGVV